MEFIPCQFCDHPINYNDYSHHITICEELSYINNINNEIYDLYSELEDITVGFTIEYINQNFPKKYILENYKCVICLENIPLYYRKLPCSHKFCADCISKWLTINKKCPLCCKNL